MLKALTIIYPYYNAPRMLQRHLFDWMLIPEKWLSKILIILVDDGSQESPAEGVIRGNGDLPFQLNLYRIKEDIPWNQHGARNLGAYVAPNTWLFMSDIDHTLPMRSLNYIMENKWDPGCFYTFNRLTANRGSNGGVFFTTMLNDRGLPKPHPNTYLLTRKRFWSAGGYDEDFCGTYGGDGPFRRWLNKVGRHEHLGEIDIVRWSREMVPDASMLPEFREKYRPLYGPKFKAKGGGNIPKPTRHLRFEWERVL